MNIRPTVTTAMLLALVSSAACADRNDSADVAKPGQIAIVNGGFEEKGGPDNIPGWVTYQHAGEKSYEMTMDAKVVSKGRQSFRMTQTNEQFYGLLEQRVPIAADMAGKPVELSAMLKTKKVNAGGWGLMLSFYDSTGYMVSHVETKGIVGSTDWKRITASAKVPANITAIAIAVQMTDQTNHGVGWIDDVQLRVVDEPAAKPAAKP